MMSALERTALYETWWSRYHATQDSVYLDRFVAAMLPWCRREVKRYAGYDTEMYHYLMTEAMLQVPTAIRDYRPGAGRTLFSFASNGINQRVKSRFGYMTGKQQRREARGFEVTSYDAPLATRQGTVSRQFPAPSVSPERSVVADDTVKRFLRRLSPVEREVVALALEGQSLTDIGLLNRYTRERARQIMMGVRMKYNVYRAEGQSG